MSSQRWHIVVRSLERRKPLYEAVVPADHWMSALKQARIALGEAGEMPPGASCNAAPDGSMTVLDPASRRRFSLAPRSAGAGQAAQPAAAAPQPAKSSTPFTTKAKKQPQVATQTQSSTQAQSQTQPRRAEPQRAAKAAPGLASPRSAGPVELELILRRDEHPDGDNPLTYLERSYCVPPDAPLDRVENQLRKALADLQHQIRSAPPGRYVHLAAFDHRWQQRPERPPLVTLRWKDWRDEVRIERPASAQPPPADAESGQRPVVDQVHDALRDLAFLKTTTEGVDLALQVLSDLLPCTAATGCLYDASIDSFRFVAVRGHGSEQARGRVIPRDQGLFGAASATDGAPSLFGDVHRDPRYQAEVDGREGLQPEHMLYMPLQTDDHLLGMLQLIDATHGAGYDGSDVEVAQAVAQRLVTFLERME